MDIVEGKDHPLQLTDHIFDHLGKKVNIFLQYTRPIWKSGSCVVLDIELYVFKGITDLHQMGVYDWAVNKKCPYWLKHIPSDPIISNFGSIIIGDIDDLQEIFVNFS